VIRPSGVKAEHANGLVHIGWQLISLN